jgi:CRP/FNR family cyclic AMP-dependent transcriptional regulator
VSASTQETCDDSAVPRKKSVQAPPRQPTFELDSFLRTAGPARAVRRYRRGQLIFTQGAVATEVFYIQEGRIKLSVVSRTGKEAVVAMLGAGDFLGEGCLAGQPRRMSTASALTGASLLAIEKTEMLDRLHAQPAFGERFLAHMLARNIRIEEDLVDQLFNSSEKRLARALLLLARYGKGGDMRPIPRLSQETLAEIVGTTRSRINFFMNKFRDLGLSDYNGDIKGNNPLITVILHE